MGLRRRAAVQTIRHGMGKWKRAAMTSRVKGPDTPYRSACGQTDDSSFVLWDRMVASGGFLGV